MQLYIHEKEATRQSPELGERLKLSRCSLSMLGGECDYLMIFQDKSGKSVYVQNGTILRRLGKVFMVRVKEDCEEVKCQSQFEYHTDGVEIEPLEPSGALERILEIIGCTNTFEVVKLPGNNSKEKKEFWS